MAPIMHASVLQSGFLVKLSTRYDTVPTYLVIPHDPTGMLALSDAHVLSLSALQSFHQNTPLLVVRFFDCAASEIAAAADAKSAGLPEVFLWPTVARGRPDPDATRVFDAV